MLFIFRTNIYLNSQAKLQQILAITRLPSPGQRCLNKGGVLKLRRSPPPRRILCIQKGDLKKPLQLIAFLKKKIQFNIIRLLASIYTFPYFQLIANGPHGDLGKVALLAVEVVQK